MPNSEKLSVKQVSKMLFIRTETVSIWCNNGKIVGVQKVKNQKYGDGFWRFEIDPDFKINASLFHWLPHQISIYHPKRVFGSLMRTNLKKRSDFKQWSCLS
jgi:hypothetical protein